MPIYDYECPKCKRVEEVIKDLKDETVPYCKKCKKHMCVVLSAPKAFILKGEGFYKPTHRKDPKTTNFEKF